MGTVIGVLLVAMGVVGYLMSRRCGPDEVRRFLIWYVFAWPFVGAGLCALFYPKLHWLYYVQFAIAAASYAVRFPDFLQRRRAKGRVEREGTHLEL